MIHRLLALWLLLLVPAWAGETIVESEESVKSAFILNFIKYVEWPAASVPNGHFKVCVTGRDDKLSDTMNLIEGKVVQGRELRVRHVQAHDDLSGCHVVVIADHDLAWVTETLNQVGRRPQLTISDDEDFISAGGIIGMTVIDRKMRFEINLDAAQKAHLRLSAQLLKLARRVIR